MVNFVNYPLLSAELLQASTDITAIFLPSFPPHSGGHFFTTRARKMPHLFPW